MSKQKNTDLTDLDQEPNNVNTRPSPRRRGCLGTLFSTIFAPIMGPLRLALTLAIVAAAVILTLQVSDFLDDPFGSIGSMFGFGESDPEVIDSRTIVLGIREMAVLQTITSDVQIDKTVVDTGPSPDAEIRVTYVGHVTAGIDLSLITEEAVIQNDDGGLTITLPPAYLTGCYLGKADVVSRKCTDIPALQDCGKIVDRMLDEAHDRGIDELREMAYEENWLELAYEEAELRIYNLLISLGYDRVAFARSDQTLPADSSCFPANDS